MAYLWLIISSQAHFQSPLICKFLKEMIMLLSSPPLPVSELYIGFASVYITTIKYFTRGFRSNHSIQGFSWKPFLSIFTTFRKVKQNSHSTRIYVLNCINPMVRSIIFLVQIVTIVTIVLDTKFSSTTNMLICCAIDDDKVACFWGYDSHTVSILWYVHVFYIWLLHNCTNYVNDVYILGRFFYWVVFKLDVFMSVICSNTY